MDREALEARYSSLVDESLLDINSAYRPESPPKRLPSWNAEVAAFDQAKRVKANAIQAYRELAAAEALAQEKMEKLQIALNTLEGAKLLYDLAWSRVVVDYPEATQKGWI